MQESDSIHLVGIKKLHQKTGDGENVIFIPAKFLDVWNDDRPIQIWRGSRFSAKSWTKALQLLLRAMDSTYFRCIYARQTYKEARDSQFQLFKDLLRRYPILRWQFVVHEQSMRITHHNGNYLQGGSFDKPETLMSVPDLTDAWFEEPITWNKSITEASFETIRGTLRNPHGVKPKVHLTFNPIGKNNFIYKNMFDADTMRYFDDEVCDLVINYVDNPFCPDESIEYLNNMRRRNPKRYMVDGLGNWGEPTNEDPFLLKYDDELHYTDEEFVFDATLETWISFDFNNKPCTATAYQIVPGVGVVAMRNFKQNGGTRMLCQLIKESDLMTVPVFMWNVTGDTSGNSYTSAGGNTNDFKIIMEEFGIGKTQLINVHGSNARLVYSRKVNDEFLFKVPFYMDKRCEDLRRDFMIAKEDGRGGLYKNRAEGYGMDFLDNHRYFVHAICPKGLESINNLVERVK